MKSVGVEGPVAARTAAARAGALSAVDRSSLASAAFAFFLLGSLGLLNGGYFSTAWGWGSLFCLWLAIVVLLVSDRIRVGRFDVAFLGGVAAFVSFVGLSASWSASFGASIRELERGVLILSALLVAILLARRRMRPLLAGALGAIAVVSSYGLATRLFPQQLGSFDSVAVYRLAEPVGYWNALGILCAIGTVLSLGFAARARTVFGRSFGSAAPVVLVPTLYFTFGRGAWLALGAGLMAAIAVDRRRLQLLTTVLALAPFVITAVWLSSRDENLNRKASALAAAAHEGRQLALLLVALTIAAAFVGPVLQLAERRVTPGLTLRRAFVGALLGGVVLVGALAFAHYGSPREIATRAYDSFRGPVNVGPTTNLSSRLFSLSSNGRLDMWRVAEKGFEAHPWAGSGAGTFESLWLKERPYAAKVRDAHSLYMEVLAELGPLGLAVLVLALAVPLAAATRVRRHPLVPFATGAYVAFLVHAGADWDWEMPAVTLAGLFCGVAVLVVARGKREGRTVTLRSRVAAGAVMTAVAAFAFVGLMGNLALASSNKAADSLNWSKSASKARAAIDWAPWSSDPLRQLAEAQYAQGEFASARANFRKAIVKDPSNWLLWAELGVSSTGGERRDAIEQAFRLNPLAPELESYRKEFGK